MSVSSVLAHGSVLQKSIFGCRGEAFAPRLIGKIKVLLRKCFTLPGFLQQVYLLLIICQTTNNQQQITNHQTNL